MAVQVPVQGADGPLGHLTLVVSAAALRHQSLETLLAGLCAACIAVGIAGWMQRRITEPLRRLTDTMCEVRETQDFQRVVDCTSDDDEVAVLVDAFNDMMGQIRQREEGLMRHRQHLQHEVEERTKDLSAAKDVAESANAAKSDFLATMSHEIRTPMNGMLVMAELLASAELSDRHRRYADVVVNSGQSLLTIINDILDFSKIESGKLELERIAFDPVGVVDDVLSLFWERAARKGLDMAAYVAPDVPDRIEGDPIRLNQILSNLVNNALKFTESGHVSLSIKPLAGASDPASLILEFAIADTGVGIPEEKLQTIFESFSQADLSTTRRFGGTGLGLAICQRLVDAMGGEIGVSSTAGQGSEFRFTIATRGLTAEDQRPQPNAVVPLRDAMLVLEDGATSQAIARYLEDRQIRLVRTPPSAFAVDDLQRVDLLLSEPHVIDRLPRAARHGEAAATPFVVCVSEMGDYRSDEVLDSGKADDVLLRPVSRNAFGALIDRLAAGAPLGPSALRRRQGAELPRYSGAHALVADDSPVNREVVIEALNRLDVRADVVADGQAAVAAARERSYDLVFMDCSMPEMDGFEATRQIRDAEQQAGRPRVPIVALTAQIAGGDPDEWRRAGMDAYMTKPYRITDLAACFDKFISHKAQDAGEAPIGDEGAGPESTQLSQILAAGSAPDGPLPVLDEEVLRAVAGCQEGYGTDLLVRVLSLFETHAPQALLKLAESAQSSGCQDIADAAHALKSLSSHIGARRLADACQDLENEARQGNVKGLVARLARLRNELLDVLARIKELKRAEVSPAAAMDV
ncbi:MAG: ATP-binding protein [Methyloligellaceae bacterium]